MRRCNYELSRIMGMRRWLTVMNATTRCIRMSIRRFPLRVQALLSVTTLRRMWSPTSQPLETTSLSLVRTDPEPRCPPIGSDLAASPASCRTALSSLSTCLPARLLSCTSFRVNPYADASIRTPAQLQEVVEFTNRIWFSVDKIKDVEKLRALSGTRLHGRDST